MSIAPEISWSESVAQRLLDGRVCPVCAFALTDGCCPSCGADLRGALGAELWEASTSAAAALRAREALLNRVPRVIRPAAPSAAPAPPAAPAPSPAPSAAPGPPAALSPAPGTPAQPTAPPQAPRPAPRSSASVQSVLAIAGAGLFAIAAFIFTFLNPDLSDRAVRSIVVGAVTVVFLGGAWLLARRRLQFSAEAVGALGLVFVALDVYSFAQLGADGTTTWLLAAAATAVAGAVLHIAGRLSRIGVWSWGAVVGIALTPPMIGYAAGSAYASAFGHVGTALLAAVLVAKWPSVARRSLTALQVVAVLTAVPLAGIGVFSFGTVTLGMLGLSAVLASIAAHALFAARHILPHWWSFVSGGAATAALTLALVSPVGEAGQWMPAVVPAAGALSFAAIAFSPSMRAVSRLMQAAGGAVVVAATAFAPLILAVSTALNAASSVARGTGAVVSSDPSSWAPSLGMAGLAAGLALFGILTRARAGRHDVTEASSPDTSIPATTPENTPEPAPATRPATLRGFAAVTDVAAVAAASIAVLMVACGDLLVLPARLAVVLGAAAVVAIALRSVRAVRQAPYGVRVMLLLGIHAAIAVGLIISWLDPRTAPLAGIGVVAALALAGRAMPTGIRLVHVGIGFAYALVCLAQALAQTALGSIAVLCLTTSAGLLVAIGATFTRRIRAREWYAVLAVAAVPFALGIVQVVFERSGWTALSTSLMFALALSLLLTRRPGLDIVLRTAASALLVPTVAVVVVCLGAQLLAVSASPVTLPIIAAVVALVLPSTTLIRDALQRNGLPADAAAAARVAIEASALLTGAIATVLALAREAAGLGTTFLVLLILGLGAAVSAAFTRRRYGWWVAGAAFTGALWCVWTMNGVDLLEAYLLPPALVAAVTAVILTARRSARPGAEIQGLYAAGLGVALLPSLALLVLIEPDARTAVDMPWRTAGLLVAGAVLLGIAAWFAPRRRAQAVLRARLAPLAPVTFAAAGVAALAGPVQGIRIGLGADLVLLHGDGAGGTLFLACFGVSAVAAVILSAAGHGIRSRARSRSRLRRSRWIQAPAALALAAGTWCAIERDWASIWLMWTLMIGMLVLMLVSAVRSRRTALPPVWFLFALSFVTAVVAWSPRDLRVEWFSLPLGGFLLLAGIVGMRRTHDGGGVFDSWPVGHRGSWRLLAPGIITMMSASIAATFTDPLTWRAILVMVLALAAIMIGAGRRLAAPFVIGMLVLPVENVFVFSVQIGRGIESMPWWITLAVIGAVLLIIAVTYERRSGDAGTVVARIRDLR